MKKIRILINQYSDILRCICPKLQILSRFKRDSGFDFFYSFLDFHCQALPLRLTNEDKTHGENV